MHQEVKNERPPSIERTFLAEIRFGKMRSAHRAIFAQAPWRLRNPVAGPGSRRATPDAHLKIRVNHSDVNTASIHRLRACRMAANAALISVVFFAARSFNSWPR